MRKFLVVTTSTIAATALLGIVAVSAQQSAPSQQQPQGMMPMMNMTQQMGQMMDACTKMMQASMAQPSPTTPPSQPQPRQ
jgi:hypothetical protein